MHRNEKNILIALDKNKLENFPKLLEHGKLNNKYSLIMTKFGDTLENYFELHQSKFTFKTVIQIGLQLVTLVEQFHEVGCVHNDLKLDNICVGGSDLNDPKCQLKLIDFGLATSYATKHNQFKKPTNPNHHVQEAHRNF